MLKEYLNPSYIANNIHDAFEYTYANNILYRAWAHFVIVSKMFAIEFPWQAEHTQQLMQQAYDRDFKHNWLCFLKMARLINSSHDNLECIKELIIATGWEWAKQDYSAKQTICIASSMLPQQLVVAAKSSDPIAPAIIKIISCPALPAGEYDQYCLLGAKDKFNLQLLQDVPS